MCGICGIVNLDGSPADAHLLAEMAEMMRHRGPDDMGTFTDGPAGIAMVRLSIIDIAGGHQPMHNEDQSAWTVCNGEIYNFKELRNALTTQSHNFYNRSDVEVIPHLYEEHRDGLVDKLRGEFALAVYDRPQRRLLLARDRLGIKPLHYFTDGSVFLFASEIKALLRHPAVRREINPDALNEYLTWNYVPEPLSIYKNIAKVPPGHRLVLENGKIRIERYWELRYDIDTTSSPEQLAERLLAELSEAVRIRLVSDTPIGAFLSGGIDSSAVVALMAKHAGRIKTFSIDFEDAQYSETEYARLVAQKYDTDHEEFTVKADASAIIDDVLSYFDEPFGDSSALPTFVVSKMARSRVKVVQSGDGGDETFAGYERYVWETNRSRYARIPAFIRAGIFRPVSRMLPEWMYGKNYLNHISLDNDARYVNTMCAFTNTAKPHLYTPEFAAKLTSVDCSGRFMDLFRARSSSDYLTRLQYVDTNTYLPGDCLVKTDRMANANSLEVRVPFLDHKVVELAATIPADLKLRNGITKYILKQSMKELLPEKILTRGKMGFAVPIPKWFSGDWADDVRQMLFEPRTLQRGYFNEAHVRRIWNEHQRGRRNHRTALWVLWVLEKWHRQYIDTDPTRKK